ncbi:protein SHORT INTERNODES-like [Silene latifolia]|uniref:protein SHORT INTERNODES-like n=1 Tax=Silene latifolia TaxID=37657 RepID=UPI003D76C07A
MRSSSRDNNNNSSDSSSTISCQDCGNKAKRDCEHVRCRSCCKSRGFKCHTHVKSTWVPVAKRRLRSQQQQYQYQHFELLPSSNNTMDYQHLDLPLSLSRSTCFRHGDSPLGPEDSNYPAEINSLANFRCIRVTSKDNMVEQYAYQTSINVGGHVFKGILYDQGPTTGGDDGGDQSSSAGTSDHPHRLHHFNMAAATTSTAQSGGGGGANLLFYPPHSLNYSVPYNALPGMQFFQHTRS